MVNGKVVRAAQLHAVATRPNWRRRGLFTDLMTRVLDYADGRFDRLLLFTAEPALYEPFGFRHLPQHIFTGRLAVSGRAVVDVRAALPRRRRWHRCFQPSD